MSTELSVGIVGPYDLVDSVAHVVAGQPGLRAVTLPYRHETEAVTIVGGKNVLVDVWLFTGIVPYTLTSSAGVLKLPSAYVDYTGSVLLEGVVRLMRSGYAVENLSIDTLAANDVLSGFHGAGIPTGNVKLLPVHARYNSEEVANQHLRHYRERRKSGAAVTCIRSVYDILKDEMPVLRLVPSRHSVLVAVRALAQSADRKIHEDARVVMGLVELPGGGDAFERLRDAVEGSAAGVVARAVDGLPLIVTTLGPLRALTNDFTTAPHVLVDGHPEEIHIGFGVGNSAAEAERHARRALGRVRSMKGKAAAVSFRHGTDIVLPSTSDDRGHVEVSPVVLAERAGVPAKAIELLQTRAGWPDLEPVTSRDLEELLHVSGRTARRILQRLENAGLAVRTGETRAQHAGRPLTAFSLRL